MKTTRHATYNLNYHIVWLPKYRQSVLVNEVVDRVRTILHEIADNKGLEVLDLTVQPDHVHLFVSSPPKNEPALLSGESHSREHTDGDDSAADGARLTAPQDSQADAETQQATPGTYAC